MASSCKIKGCSWILTQDESRRILRGCSVYIYDGRIVEVKERIPVEAEYTVDGSRRLLMPGLINTHTHLPMTLVRGYADDMELKDWLEGRIWPLEKRLTASHCYAGALLGCLEMIKTGTTTFVDMYWFSEEVAKAAYEAGLRAVVSCGMIDSFNPELRERQMERGKGFIRFVKELKDPRIQAALGPHAPYTCSPELLSASKAIADQEGLLIHIHIAESRGEQAEFERRFGVREVNYLDKIGFLGGNVLAAHCVWLTKMELKLLAEKGVKISHCPVSNAKVAQGGVSPIPEALEYGVTVSLGTDGAASNNCLDLFETIKFAALIHKHHRWDPKVMPAKKLLDLATIKGAEALRMDGEVGSIKVGKRADLILIDMRNPSLTPIHSNSTIASHLVYASKGINVDTVIVDGRILMLNKDVQTLNEEEVYKKAQEAALNLTSS